MSDQDLAHMQHLAMHAPTAFTSQEGKPQMSAGQPSETFLLYKEIVHNEPEVLRFQLKGWKTESNEHGQKPTVAFFHTWFFRQLPFRFYCPHRRTEKEETYTKANMQSRKT